MTIFKDYRVILRIVSQTESAYWVAMFHNMVRNRRNFTGFYGALTVAPDGSVYGARSCFQNSWSDSIPPSGNAQSVKLPVPYGVFR